MRFWRFTTRQLLTCVTLLAVALTVGQCTLYSYRPIAWQDFTVANLKSKLDDGRTVLVVYQGRAGGLHQYVLVSETMQHPNVRRAIRYKRVVPMRADFYATRMRQSVLNAQAVTVPQIPFQSLLFILQIVRTVLDG